MKIERVENGGPCRHLHTALRDEMSHSEQVQGCFDTTSCQCRQRFGVCSVTCEILCPSLYFSIIPRRLVLLFKRRSPESAASVYKQLTWVVTNVEFEAFQSANAMNVKSPFSPDEALDSHICQGKFQKPRASSGESSRKGTICSTHVLFSTLLIIEQRVGISALMKINGRGGHPGGLCLESCIGHGPPTSHNRFHTLALSQLGPYPCSWGVIAALASAAQVLARYGIPCETCSSSQNYYYTLGPRGSSLHYRILFLQLRSHVQNGNGVDCSCH
jgi:hypothetical protein